MSKPSLEDYIEVPERIQRFYEKYPDGSLQGTWEVAVVADDTLLVYTARAYRTSQDPTPGVGTASEPYPGKTQFTRGSELMNAETSAWGRAIVALGFLAKDEKVASKEEVNLAQHRRDAKPLAERVKDLPGTSEVIGEDAVAYIKKLRGEAKVSPQALKAHVVATHGKDTLTALTTAQANAVEAWLRLKKEANGQGA